MIELTSAQAVREHYRTVQMRMRKQFRPRRPPAPIPIPIVDATPETVAVEVTKPEPPELPITLAVQLFARPPTPVGQRWRPHPVISVRNFVAEKYGLSVEEIIGDCRRKIFVQPRHIAIYLCTRHTTHSFPSIARHFGDRDHTTLIAAARNIKRLRLLDAAFDSELQALETSLGDTLA